MRLKDKVAIITGGCRGIGKGVAKAFAKEGAYVVIASENEERLVKTAKELHVYLVKTDVTRIREVKRLIDHTGSRYGKIDILVNAAGVQLPIGPLIDVNSGEWIRNVETNLIGTMLCCKYVLPYMISNRKGKIINFGEGGAITPRPNFSAYASSKAAVVRFTETIAEEVKDFNIDINAIHPGSVDTKMIDDVIISGIGRVGEKEFRNALEVKKGNSVSLEEVGGVVVFLASEASDGITGRILYNVWDGWRDLAKEDLENSSLYTLRRIDGRRYIEK